MVTSLAASFALLAPPSEGTWGPTKLTAMQLAKRADVRLATLSQKLLTYHFEYRTAKEGYAFSDCKATIVSPGVFSVQVPRMDPKDAAFIRHENWVSNGKLYGSSLDPKPPIAGALATRPAPTPHPLSIWFAQFPNVILSGLGRPTQNFQRLIADAATQKWNMAVQTRSLKFQGRQYVSNRLVLTKGTARYEIVFDGHQDLPVNVTNTVDKDFSHWGPLAWSAPTKPLSVKDISFKV